jgi:hypothetical protein
MAVWWVVRRVVWWVVKRVVWKVVGKADLWDDATAAQMAGC